ncbi:helix-turn-helix domain-containing protein [Actinophytocola glycyrrhizae]|uniref:Helix-turn-helix domain-containing protein n=1 Tax=Actinophytocola glycyrrhizae TaxID=2044873 RepID=A0ABV9S2S3_9PSEU
MIEHALADGVAEQFGSLLRRLRTDTGLTQRMLADLSTISERAIRDLEQGKARPRTDTVRLIAEALRLGRFARASLERAANTGRGSRPTLDAVLAAPPAVLNTMIGREQETAAVTGELVRGTSRLVVLRGLPGVGKTRLAVEVARALHTGSRMPVLWLTRPGAIAADSPAQDRWLADLLNTAARALFDAGHDLTALTEAIGDRDTLLVLDDGLPRTEAVLSLLGECPGLRVLVTTTETAALPGERAFLVAPLAVPDGTHDARAVAAAPAVRLFLTHLDRARPGYRLTAAHAPVVADICAAVDGLPPALATAASWLAVYDLPALSDLLRIDPAALLDPGLLARLAAHVAALPAAERAALTALADLGPDASLPGLAAATGHDPAAAGLLLRNLVLHGVVRARQTAAGSRFRVLALTRPRPRS